MTTPVEVFETGHVPAWTVGDRLRKAREVAGLHQDQLSTEIGVSRTTIRNYEAEKVQPRRPVLLAWALRCGVPLHWLQTGEEPRQNVSGEAMRAPRDSNPQPSDP